MGLLVEGLAALLGLASEGMLVVGLEQGLVALSDLVLVGLLVEGLAA